VLVNPAAGGGRGRALGARTAASLSAAGQSVQLRQSGAAGDATLIAREARLEGLDRVVVVGGDGTLHEAVNGLIDPSCSAEDGPALGIVPIGTGNDYAKMFGLSSPEIAIKRLIDGAPQAVDLGLIKRPGARPELFLNNVGGGFLAEANEGCERMRPAEGRRGATGHMPYFLGGLWALLHHQAAELSVCIDGEEFPGPFSLFHIALGRFCGGGIDLIPEARVDDSQFQVMLLSARSSAALLTAWPRLESGKGARVSGVSLRSARELQLWGGPFSIHADGEARRLETATISLLPRRLRVVS